MDQSNIIETIQAFIEYAIQYAKDNYQIELDYSEKSIGEVEKILCSFHDSLKEFSETAINGVCLVWGAYIGEVFRRNFGGEWCMEDVMGEKDVITYKVNDIRIFPVSKVYKRLTNGSGDDVQFYFQVFKAKILESKAQ